MPVGLTSVAGHFERGDCVALMAADGQEIGRGLSAYASTEAQRMIGLSSDAMENELGYRGRAEMVHRDDMVLHGKASYRKRAKAMSEAQKMDMTLAI